VDKLFYHKERKVITQSSQSVDY